jgi:predicted nucleic acid-binding protein
VRSRSDFAIHRRYREKQLTRKEMLDLTAAFRSHVERGTWNLVPVSESLLWAVHEALRDLRNTVFIRSADATHLVTARMEGFTEVWTNDGHMLKAARHFHLTGRSVCV